MNKANYFNQGDKVETIVIVNNQYFLHLTAHEQNLHKQTVELVKEERRLTGLVIDNLKKISDSKLYLKMGYSSIFEYCTRGLGYSESCAYRRISAVRLAKTVPEVREKLNSGALNLTNLSMAQSLFAKANVSLDNKKEILAKLEHRTKREAEEILAKEAENRGLPITAFASRETVRTLPHDQASLHIRVKRQTIHDLDRIKELRSHKNPRMTYGDVIEDVCDFVLKKIDPERRNNFVKQRHDPLSNPQSSCTNPRYISPQLRQAVWTRDQSRCTYVDPVSKKRCTSRHLLQMDHIQPVSCGGPTTLDNLRLLCHAHHRLRDIY